MADITKLTKAQLIAIIEESEENKFESFKSELGLPYQTDEEWIDFIKSLQSKVEDSIQADKVRSAKQRKDLFSRS
tara:strand:+ start:69 stop:293 length:225 start_codon:yes stop_codon:yes gene_type:complete